MKKSNNSPVRGYRFSQWAIVIAVGLVAFLWGLQLVLAALFQHDFFGGWSRPWLIAWGNGIAFTIVIVLGQSLGKSSLDWKPQELQLRPFLSVGLVALGGSIVLSDVNNGLRSFVPMSESLMALFNQFYESRDVLAVFFGLCFVAPLTEEVFFRGLVLKQLKTPYGQRGAIILSSLFFALIHGNVWQSVGAFVAGLYLGLLYCRYQSVFYPILCHSLFNGLPYLFKVLGWQIVGYNTALTRDIAFQNPVWLAFGSAILWLGLLLSFPSRGWRVSPKV